ncbi:serine peptidase [Streptomyces sp. NBC_00887]|uniref:serine peptidase n=1 Tax=Streptomyces sp. NBC_00887 TaxID=2975859 RepID=UPI00386B0B9A|nr:serine peptidase [Streptomyces sp. NBC_00887]WSY36395.1 serine peptidase [Streptomyces sp. NBC_00887]
MGRIVVVHGVGNFQKRLEPGAAARKLADGWQGYLAHGYKEAGLDHLTVPGITVAYYAYLLRDAEGQGAGDELDQLSPAQQQAVLGWLRVVGMPDEPAESQSWGGMPVRQAIDLVARRRGLTARVLGRIVVAFMPEVYSYLASPERRRRARDEVARTIEHSGAKVVVAHSLGSIVTYEALHAYPDLGVEVLITVGSPLGVPGAVFDMLDPAPDASGRGTRPPGLRHWANIAEAGDLVALPRRLGDRFPVDSHHEAHMSPVDFHTLNTYFASGLTASALAPYCVAP